MDIQAICKSCGFVFSTILHPGYTLPQGYCRKCGSSLLADLGQVIKELMNKAGIV